VRHMAVISLMLMLTSCSHQPARPLMEKAQLEVWTLHAGHTIASDAIQLYSDRTLCGRNGNWGTGPVVPRDALDRVSVEALQLGTFRSNPADETFTQRERESTSRATWLPSSGRRSRSPKKTNER